LIRKLRWDEGVCCELIDCFFTLVRSTRKKQASGVMQQHMPNLVEQHKPKLIISFAAQGQLDYGMTINPTSRTVNPKSGDFRNQTERNAHLG
jgi:hypothetical protein